ncbi:HAD-IB family hydrolase/lysophospholipid acyltransferase family protein [Mycobacterium pseudoshottsii]|uniref:HAD-IB family hydrolase/lysophospholipid acyltransferase family protein n=1 Tax=Mycobacterium pseudoshottsii TaxID=265949 RepID=UPI00076E8BD3|nr:MULTISPECIES: HAD-IB family hydrolase/lysophospholipid acyltransferase family protein [Mycobacterium ulcerans group]MBC9863290.1 Phosphoserine phosphatase / Acyl-CoA:1-acyl-sn-glycerol-3-phosphate acyltransferase [Mycobacterium pseudoshottsii]RFZ60034.1 1-acyl-sn-glycerol-3-phosphate acyltransferase [Mycobacterium marinum]BBA89286.1 L-3-phosphoserine phosphatase [Mycobacterium pseudoshottsii JCM 15466]GAQ35248.1 phosphoserine phosphatase [Mycobacterium pseudoshottsii JCM 15466]
MSAAEEPGDGREQDKAAGDLRLPGSVAEIMASPAGPKVGAFFDLDGTLVAGFTAVILTQERLRRRDIGVGELLSMVQAGLNHTLGRIEFEQLINTASSALRGRQLVDLEEIGERLFAQRIESRIYPEMRELVRAHVARGHTVVLSSSALTIQVNPVARFLGIVNMLTNKFETNEDGLLTGGVVKPILWGPGKAAAVQRFAAEHDIDLKDSYFYADGDEDVALMYLVGNPRPTNPEGKMAAVAKRRGWPILKFNSRGGVGLRRQIRTLAGFSTMFPVAAGAVGIGLLTGNRRRGVNFFTSNFSQLLLATSGVHLNVVGKENLTAQRPAVFIFNHRNQVDPVIAGALVRDNWVGVGKKELQNDPIMGTLGKVLDGVFIDRDDPASAVETLHTVEERAKNGLSIVIAPEGTRLDTTEVGPFKKGPFRIAMAAGIPIVPIVIRNAEIVASRNSTTINPGTVDIAVFPPIPVDDWTLDTLPDRIAEVRQLYLDTLKDWPVDELPEVNLYAEEKAAKKAKAQLAKASAKETPAEKAPAKKAAAKKETPAKKAPAKKAPAKKAPAKKAPAKKAPAKKATAKKAPAKKAPAKKVPESAAAKAATPATDTELSAPKPVGEASNPTEIAPEPIAHDGDAQQLGAGRSDAAESSSSRPKGRP